MTTITADELSERTREVLTDLAKGGEAVAVTLDGAVVAELSPAPPAAPAATEPPPDADAGDDWTDEQWDAYWARVDRLAEEISARWPEGVSAVDAIREDRSRLDDFLARNDPPGEAR